MAGKANTTKTPRGADQLPNLKDGFGFRLESQVHEFGKMLLRKDGCTMAQVREAEWNKRGLTYYATFKKLVGKGLAAKRADGRMVATAKARGKQ